MKVGQSIISNNITELTIRRPDDWHVHLREGLLLEAVLPFTARQFARAIVMPNLTEPVTNTVEAENYRSLILKALANENGTREFTPLMTAYLTDMTKASDSREVTVRVFLQRQSFIRLILLLIRPTEYRILQN